MNRIFVSIALLPLFVFSVAQQVSALSYVGNSTPANSTQTTACARLVWHYYSSTGECMNYTCYEHDNTNLRSSATGNRASCNNRDHNYYTGYNRGNSYYGYPGFDRDYYSNRSYYDDDYYCRGRRNDYYYDGYDWDRRYAYSDRNYDPLDYSCSNRC